MRKLAFAAIVAPLFAFAAMADGSPWGVATFAGGETAELTRVNELGEAVLTDADLGGNTLTGIAFQGDTPVASIVLSDQTVRFSGNCLLTVSESSSAFVLTGGDWTFDGLAFVGNGRVPMDLTPIAHEGGAINAWGGKLTLTDCAFTNCAARFSGGAVNALEMLGDVVVSNCTFVGNQTGAINGSGGAIYASGATDRLTLRVTDCCFERNGAQNGGAISTRHTTTDAERPMRLEILKGNAFEGNGADYEGGAVFAGGEVSIVGPNVLFEGNSAGDVGGALGLNGVPGHFAPVAVTISNGVTFADNSVCRTNGVNAWTAGGAVGVMIGGCVLDVDGAIFTNNVAKVERVGQPAFGGAIYTTEGVTNVFRRTAFVDNDATSGKVWCYGGAVSVEGGRTTVDTCVFDYGGKQNAKAYGNAIDFNGTDVSILNSTFRRGKVEAISAYNSPIMMTNCVVVGNGAAGDLYIEGQTVVSMAYCAYGVCQVQYPAMVTGVFNLSGRVAADVYDGESLRLDGSDFNPVAGLGLRQPGVLDFVGTEYGSRPYGFSMGAFETNTSPRVVNAYGTREYDGTTSSNGCLWTNWTLTDTNFQDAAFAELVPEGADVDSALQLAFTVTNWVFGTEANGGAVGHYDSTNATDSAFFLSGGLKPIGVTNEWLSAVLVYRLCGDIAPATTNAFEVYFSPTDFPWDNGNPVEPTNGYVRAMDGSVVHVVISNMFTHEELDLGDFEFSYDGNRDPTASAELIATCTNGNFSGVSQTNDFSITAYVTRYYQDGLPSAVTTNGWLSGSNACAAVEAPAGSCVDWQNSLTNGTVEVYKTGAPQPITTFVVRYERDVAGEGSNPGTGDGVPDKYQRKFLFMTVNGWWKDEQNGADKVRWVTLTNSATGNWDAEGVGTLTAGTVPSGVNGWSGYADSGWWYNDSAKAPAKDIVGTPVSSQSFAFFFYNPDRAEAPGASRTNPGPDAETKPELQSVVKSVLRIADFSFDGDRTVTGSVEADVTDGTGKSLLDPDSKRPLENVRIEVLGAASLGGEWDEQFVVDTDADGNFQVNRIRKARFFKVQLKQAE